MEVKNFKIYKGAWLFAGEPHLSEKISKQQAKYLLSKGGLMVRNAHAFDQDEISSFWYVIKSDFGGIEELPTKVRNMVRNSLKKLDIRKVSSDELLTKGYEVYQLANLSYKVKADGVSFDEFRKRIKLHKNYEYWACFDKETSHMVAFSINHVFNSHAEYETMKANPEYLKGSFYPYYGLLFAMNEYYLQSLQLDYVNDGTRSITEHSNIQPFLIKNFNFRKAYCQLQIEYVWWLKLIIYTLYPFKNLIKIPRLRSLLNMEAMKRNEML